MSSQVSAVIEDRTHRDTVRFTLTWTFENFSALQHERKMMYSIGVTMAALGMEDDYQGRWRIGVRPSHNQTKDNIVVKCLSFFLFLTDENEASTSYTGKDISVEYDSRITTGKTTKSDIRKRCSMRFRTFSSTVNNWGRNDAVPHSDLFGFDQKEPLLTDDCITITMDIAIYKAAQTVQVQKAVLSNSAQRYKQSADRQSKWFAAQQQRKSPELDFILQSSDGGKFHTSRWILMAHSPVFAAMLKDNSDEAKTSRCEMTDVDAETTEIILNYMYGCQIDKIDRNNAEKVLVMADKYEIMDLRDVCEELLASNVAVNKAVHYLVLASQRGLETLKAAALHVIPKNMATVLKDGALEEAVQADPYLMQTIMEHCSKRTRVIDES